MKAEEPKIGVYICRCRGEIADKIDVKSMTDFTRQLPHVSVVKAHDAFCTKEGQTFLKESVEKEGINRVVVAACTPKIYEDIISKAVQDAGLNKYMYEQANIREHCAWVHEDRDIATEKAKALVAMAVAKATHLEPLLEPETKVNNDALVIGGGVAGMQAALDLASLGFKTYLVEREPILGGRTYQLSTTFPTISCGICCLHNCKACILTPKVDEVYLNDKIEVLTNSEVVDVTGHIGDYKAKIRNRNGDREVNVGAIILATGSKTFDPSGIPEYGYKSYKDVITSLELSKLELSQLRRPSNGRIPKTVNFILCVGSRGERKGNPHCSIVCCTYAVGMAREIKNVYPDTEVYIHFIDLRAPYRGFEEYCDEARKMGVNFIRGRVAEVEKVGDKLVLATKDLDIGRLVKLESELVVLCVGQEPSDGTEALSKILYRDLDIDGFFKEVNLKFSFMEETGVFVAGCAQGARNIRYSVADGKIAAANAATILANRKMKLKPLRAQLDEKHCDGCAFCVDPCPYKVITLHEYLEDGKEKKIVELNELTCRGCGVCQATCPQRAIYVRQFTPDQLSAMVNAALETAVGRIDPLIIGFVCNWCGYPVADQVGTAKIQYPPNLLIVRVMCSGMVHPSLVIDALTKGADGVLICGCPTGDCHYIDGNSKAEKRAEAIEVMLEDFGIERQRFRIELLSASEARKFVKVVKQMVEDLRALGPSPYRQKVVSASKQPDT